MNKYLKNVLACLSVVAMCGGLVAMPNAYAGAESSSKAKQEQSIPAKVNVNKASAEELSLVLKGIGLKKAQAIVAYRKAKGKFKSIEQLAEVKGIGQAIISKNRSKLVL